MSEPNGNGKRDWTPAFRWFSAIMLGLLAFLGTRLVTQADETARAVNNLTNTVSGFMGRAEQTDRDHGRRIDRLEDRVFTNTRTP